MAKFNICFSCMTPMTYAHSICPHCGKPICGVENALHQLPLGTILEGKYMVGPVLGQGGFGITYMGHEFNLGTKVAIKEYYPQGVVSRLQTGRITVSGPSAEQKDWFDKSLNRFLGEAKALAKFSYLGNIVNVFDFFLGNGTAYIVMDYVEGKTARGIALDNGGKLPSAVVLGWMYPLMESLSEIHGKSLLHRDIAPDNIMVRAEDNKAVLLDFGAARQISLFGELSNTVNVKHGYAPVEQYQTHGNQGPWTDVYAICASIYRLTTGVTPKQAIDRAMDKTNGKDELLPPNKLGADFTPAQQAAIMKGLSIDLRERQQSMMELYKELKAGEHPTPKRCKKCGGEIDPITKKCPKCSKGNDAKARIALACVIAAVLVLIASAINYSAALKAMSDRRFEDSKKAFDRLIIAELICPEAYRYVEAETLAEQGIIKNENDALTDFLEGTWKTADGVYMFSLKRSGDSTQAEYSLPKVKDGSRHSIKNGVFYVSDTATYRFDIKANNKMDVYCYKDRNTYTMYRR